MNCPRTRTKLKKINVGKIPVFVSEKCGGVFLENRTLTHFECPTGDRGKALANHLSQFSADSLNLDERVSCPTCSDTVMLRRYYSPLYVVEIDECPGCGGIWLDTGELRKLQSLMLNEKDKAILRSKLLDEHRQVDIKGLPHFTDIGINRDSKIDNLLNLATYLTRGWW